MISISLFGFPGAGKGTQAKLLSKKLNLVHISTGDMIRNAIAKKSPAGIEAEKIIKAGGLLDDHIISRMLRNELWKIKNPEGILLDGYPRTIVQAEVLDGILKDLDSKLDALIELVISEQECIQRLLKRAKKEKREDDNPETIKNRFMEYRSKSAPVVDYYSKKGIYFGVEGTGSIEDVNKLVLEVIKMLH